MVEPTGIDFVQVTPLKVKPSKETFKVVGIPMEYTYMQ